MRATCWPPRAKEVDLATNNSTELENLRGANPEQTGLLRVVWESPDIPESPLVWRDSLPAALKQKIAAFTERFGASDEEKGILWNIDKMCGFRRSSNRQLVTVADIGVYDSKVAKELPLLRAYAYKARIQAD